MNYARGILAARTKAGLSKRQLARSADVDPSFITRLEAGDKQPSLDTLEAIARATDTPLAVIMLYASEGRDLINGVTVEDAMVIAERLVDIQRSAEPRRGKARK